MPDPRIVKLAQVLVNYSLAIKPNETLMINATTLAEELVLEVYREAVKAGAHVTTSISLPGLNEIFFKHASDAQLEFVSPIRKMVTETFDARLSIDSDYNTKSLTNIDPARMAKNQKAHSGLMKTFMERSANGSLKWCATLYPTHAQAQEAEMSLEEYQDFVFEAGMLNEVDPVAAWQAEGKAQQTLIKWLTGRDKVVIKGADVDLSFSIKGRTFEECSGKMNFPDGEIFTAPVEDSANGWIRLRYPAIYAGKEVIDVELRFENGKVVAEKAAKGEEILTSALNLDAGSRFLGEWGIGTNYHIQHFTKNMLFDEKLGGTIHLAVGAGYPETGSKNESAVHWDMLCDMASSEITVDGELFYKDGKTVISNQ